MRCGQAHSFMRIRATLRRSSLPVGSRAAMHAGFTERLANAVLGGRAPACVGLDPRLDALPSRLARDGSPAERILAFAREVMPLIARHVPVLKPNIAFFECHGAAGFGVYEEVCRMARALDLLVIGDVKRGDIGATAEAYAAVHLELADAVTLHPYLGTDAIQPFLTRARELGRALFVLVRTSNPGARDFQDLEIGTPERRTLAETVAAAVHRLGEGLADRHGYTPVGAVVGATWPREIARLRALMPRAWFLLPGVGAQGARVDELAPAFDGRGLGAVVSQSRGVLQCFDPGDADWRDRVEAALVAFVGSFKAIAPVARRPS